MSANGTRMTPMVVVNLRVTLDIRTSEPQQVRVGMADAIAQHLLDTFNDDDSIYRIEHTDYITREHRMIYDKERNVG